MAAGWVADGHGKWPGIARPFRAIEGTNQGGKRGKSKTKERGLIPPINFGISRLNRADLGEEMARFTGEREEAERLEVKDDPTGGTRAPACMAQARTRAARAAGSARHRARRREARLGPGGEEEEVCQPMEREERKTRGGERGLQPRVEGGRGKLWARLSPKEEGGVTFSFSF